MLDREKQEENLRATLDRRSFYFRDGDTSGYESKENGGWTAGLKQARGWILLQLRRFPSRGLD